MRTPKNWSRVSFGHPKFGTGCPLEIWLGCQIYGLGRILCSHTNTGYVTGGFGAVPAKQGRLGGGTSGLTHATIELTLLIPGPHQIYQQLQYQPYVFSSNTGLGFRVAGAVGCKGVGLQP
jgi:hypothetical protein